MKEYFVIKQNTEIPIIGCIPQTRFEPKGLNSNMLIYQDNWKDKIDDQTVFDLAMESKARLTNIITDPALIDASSICYSEDVRNIFKYFNIDKSIRAKVNLHLPNNSKLNYEYLSLLQNRHEFIDWEKSRFCKTRLRFYDKDLEINSIEDYISTKQLVAYNKIHTGGLYLEKSKIEFDLFYIGLPVNCIFVSMPLMNALEGIGSLGKEFVSADNYSAIKFNSRIKKS